VSSRERVLDAFDSVRRADFLPPEQRGFAPLDRALNIGYQQTNSQPTTVRDMLELLDVRPGHKVLDVGCGSGWTTALLGKLVGSAGQVHGVEIVPELVAWGQENLARYQLPWARIHAAEPGGLGLRSLAPFDRVLVSAEATTVPGELVDQLGTRGVMVVPVAGRMTEVRRTGGKPDVVKHGHYSFVPLVGSAGD
jgi:protein-L-isoaspartate(D-aspartate) O-methyltransferase